MKKLRIWWKPWTWFKRSTAHRNIGGSILREFIYLDTNSVTSLLVSLSGELTDQIKQASSAEQQSQLGGVVSASAAGIKLDSTTKYQTTDSKSLEITKKANTQSLFKQLIEEVNRHELLFGGSSEHTEDAEKPMGDRIEDSKLCLPVDNIRRGQLIELDVRLYPDELFLVSSMVDEFVDMQSSITQLGALPSDVQAYGKFMKQLMVGLIPINCEVVSHTQIDHNGGTYVVPSTLADQGGLKKRPISLVGVTEKERYWKDIRQLLFARTQVRVLARVSNDGINADWTPVKLEHLFAPIPQMGAAIAELRSASNTLLRGLERSDDQTAQFRQRLAKFVDIALGDGGSTLAAAQMSGVTKLIDKLVLQPSLTADAFAEATDKVGDLLTSYGVAIYVTERTHYRTRAAQLIPQASQIQSTTGSQVNGDTVGYIEAEIIAMYW